MIAQQGGSPRNRGNFSSTATLTAMALPWLFRTFGFDPAFGSGPLATVIQDLLSIWIYLLVGTFVIG
jgi:magnesium transporter